MAKAKRNGNIELLRFLFCVCVILHHFHETLHGGLWFRTGYLSVEFFFMLSGCFLARKLFADRDAHRHEPVGVCLKESGAIVFARIRALYLPFVLSTMLGVFVAHCLNFRPVADSLGFLSDLLFLQNLGFRSIYGTGTSWYLSALFFAMFLLVPILRRYFTVFASYISPLLALIIYGNLTHKYGHLCLPDTFWGFANTGILRAVAGLSLGAFVFVLSDRLRSMHFKADSFVLSAAEALLYVAVFIYIVFAVPCTADAMIPLLMGAALTVTMSGKTLFYGRLNNAFFRFLGKSSMLLYMNHYYWTHNLKSILHRHAWTLRDPQIVLLGIALSVCSAAAVFLAEKLLRHIWSRIRPHLQADVENTDRAMTA